MTIVDFHTGKNLFTLEHVKDIIRDLIDECASEDEMKSVDTGLTVFEAKLLLDEIERLSK